MPPLAASIKKVLSALFSAADLPPAAALDAFALLGVPDVPDVPVTPDELDEPVAPDAEVAALPCCAKAGCMNAMVEAVSANVVASVLSWFMDVLMLEPLK